MNAASGGKRRALLCAFLVGSSVALLALARGACAAESTNSKGRDVRLEEPTLDAIVPMALSPLDGVAVLMYPGRRMRTVHIGDQISATHARIKSVMSDRLVLDEAKDNAPPQLVWLFKPVTADAVPVVRRITSSAPADVTPDVQSAHFTANRSNTSSSAASPKLPTSN